MVSMMQDLKGNINRDSEHYKSLKEGLLSSRREYISEKKQTYFEEDSSSGTSSSDENEENDAATNALLRYIQGPSLQTVYFQLAILDL